jgi:signal transduction histidine kinase
MKSAILASFSSQVAVLDHDGIVIAINEAWRRIVHKDGLPPEAQIQIGDNYVETWRRAAAGSHTSAAIALAGLEDVLGGRRPSFAYEYAGGFEPAIRWYALSVVPLQRPDGGAVVTHLDVTERKGAELEAQRTRLELAHFARISTMGALTSSLAHQLNQPLTGILANAQAARRFLQASPLDIAEISDIVADIIEDDRRAGDVIRRMREMTSRTDRDIVVLDANSLIRDVAMLIASDTIIRNVSVSFHLTPEAARIKGNRVELQQAFLNVLVNAMDAISDCPVEERRVAVRSERTSPHELLVSIIDGGPGLLPQTEAAVFEPFFTTKPTAMGMGLSIARSIVEAHGGRIWADSNVNVGATFRISLPLAETRV